MSAGGRRFGLVPRAVTPLRPLDLLAGAVGHVDGTGLDEFREAIASRLGARHVATYPSFRHAICSCLRGLATADPEARTGVVVPAYSCPDFFVAIEEAGLDAVPCDVDPSTLAIDLDSAEAAITSDTLAVLAVNHLGYGNRMDALRDLCTDCGVYLVEDLGYSFGTEFEGGPLGTFGEAAVLNFKEGKAVPVGGGMVTSNREWLDVSDAGRDSVSQNAPILFGYTLFAMPTTYGLYEAVSSYLERSGVFGRTVSLHSESGDSMDFSPPHSTMSAFQGGVGTRVLERLDAHRRRRAETASYYEERLADLDGLSQIRRVPGVSNVQYIRYPILLEDEPLRERVRSALVEVGIDAAALYRSLDVDADEHPDAARVRRRILTLPTHPYVRPADRRVAVDVVRQTVRTARQDRRPIPS